MYRCKECDFESESKRGVSVHKARTHADDVTAKVECQSCGSLTEKYKRRIERSENHFCSDGCRKKWWTKQCEENIKEGENHYAWKGGTDVVPCENCGSDVEIIQSRQKYDNNFCTQSCYGEWISENMTGENSTRWKEDSINYISYGKYWKIHRLVVKNYYSICQRCGDNGESSILDVHHIVPYRVCDTDKEANRLSNLILLCRSCHKKVEHGLVECPETDSTEKIMKTLNEPCHDWCKDHAEEPGQIINEIQG